MTSVASPSGNIVATSWLTDVTTNAQKGTNTMNVMTVGELREMLENYDDETPVMIAHQPSWPLAEIVGGIVGPEDVEIGDDDDEPENVVWLVAGGHAWDRSPYAPRSVFESL